MRKSKRVRDGDFVSIRGDKIIRKGARTGRLVGVYRDAQHIGLTSLDGEIKYYDVPAGVQFLGPVRVKMA